MIYKVMLMGGAEIAIPTKAEVSKIYEAIDAGRKWVATSRGMITIASISGITAHHELNEEVRERMKYGETLAQAEATVLKAFPEARSIEDPERLAAPETADEIENRKRYEALRGRSDFGSRMDGSPSH
jgi:hypothetical protein